MIACYRGFRSVVALLSGCPFLDVNRQDKEGDTALMLAVQAGARLLSPPSTRLGHSPTLFGPTDCSVGWRVGLGLHHPFPSIQDLPSVFCRPRDSGESPAQLLLGLDLERRDQRALTALMKAAIRDCSECVAALLMAGA